MVLYRLRRHPLPVVAHFGHCLVLTYAGRADVLQEYLPPGLEIERLERCPELGFLAVALVQTHGLRPAGLPSWLGRDFFLAGYRLFCRFRDPRGINIRGLRILRSDTDRRMMACFGNLLTHYRYRQARVRWSERAGELNVEVLPAPRRPLGWINVHSGFDDTSRALRSVFGGPPLQVIELSDPRCMSERSLASARQATIRDELTITASPASLPLADGTVDVACLLLAVHELRDRAVREQLFRELYRVLCPGGRIVLGSIRADCGISSLLDQACSTSIRWPNGGASRSAPVLNWPRISVSLLL